MHGVLTPMAGNLIAFGSGIVQLLTANVYATDLRTLTIVSASVLGLCVIAYAIDRRRLAFLPFIAPGIALFFAARSLQNYFMFWPVALVAYHFSSPEDVRSIIPLEQRSRVSAALVAVGALAVVLLGFMIVRNTTAPAATLHVSMIRYGYNPATNGVNSFEVRVENGDHKRAHDVRFGVLQQGNGSRFDYWVERPQYIGPDDARDLRIDSPSVDDEIRPGNNTVQVVAIDADSGVQVYSDPESVAQPSAGLVNARLSSWQAGPPSTPVGWEYSRSPTFPRNGLVPAQPRRPSRHPLVRRAAAAPGRVARRGRQSADVGHAPPLLDAAAAVRELCRQRVSAPDLRTRDHRSARTPRVLYDRLGTAPLGGLPPRSVHDVRVAGPATRLEHDRRRSRSTGEGRPGSSCPT